MHRHFCAAVLLCVAASDADSAVVCSPTLNIPVPEDSEGAYINLITGVAAGSEGQVPGFDVEMYASVNSNPSGQLRFYWGSASSGNFGLVSAADSYAVLAPNAIVDGTALYSRAAFTGDTSAWQAGTDGYLGLKFNNDALPPKTYYGWMSLTTTAPRGFPLTVHSWCYEDSSAAIMTPAVTAEYLFADGFEGPPEGAMSPLGRDVHIVDSTGGRRNRQIVLTQSLHVDGDCLANQQFDFGQRRTCRHASRQVRDVRRIVVRCLLDNYGVAHGNLTFSSPPA